MKNAVKIRISVAMIAVAAVLFSGCSKDNDNDNLVSGAFNGTVTANVDGGAGLTVNAVLAVNEPEYDPNTGNYYGNSVGDWVNFTNGSFTISLPTSGIKRSYLTDATDFFEYFMKAGDRGNLKVSDVGVGVMDVDFIGLYIDENDAYVTGIFLYATANKSVTCMFVYADGDVDVTGGANVNVSLKKGWNRVYLSDKLTTKAPDGLKWHFDYF